MLHTPRKPSRVSARNRICNLIPGTTILHNLILRMRRARRVCRPILPVAVRLLIVIFAILHLRPLSKPASPHASVPDTIASLSAARHAAVTGAYHAGPYEHILPFISRAAVIAAFMSALLSVIFFDARVLNFLTVAAILLNVLLVATGASTHSVHMGSSARLISIATFHCTAIMFSALVGRRRSICKPSALRASLRTAATAPYSSGGGGTTNKATAACCYRYYLASLRGLRNVDVLEAGTRVQASVLAIDFALAQPGRISASAVVLPFAGLFAAGYATRKNGVIVVALLLGFSAAGGMQSSILGFDFIGSVSTAAGALLGLVVGPGLLTVDEWLATANQLCY